MNKAENNSRVIVIKIMLHPKPGLKKIISSTKNTKSTKTFKRDT